MMRVNTKEVMDKLHSHKCYKCVWGTVINDERLLCLFGRCVKQGENCAK